VKHSMVTVAGWAHGKSAFETMTSMLENKGNITMTSAAGLYPDYVAGLLKRCEEQPSPPVIMGWSMGAMIAMEAVLRAPGAAAKLVLISGTARFCRSADYSQGFPERSLTTMMEQLESDKSATLESFLKLAARPGHIEAPALENRVREAATIDRSILVDGLQYLLKTDIREVLGSICVPTLILHGNKDRVVPISAGEFLAEQLSDSTFVRMENSGHDLPISAAEKMAKTVSDFIGQAT
jgi:pimeloyl-[acyl-carrier protein] methyl ester esterase